MQFSNVLSLFFGQVNFLHFRQKIDRSLLIAIGFSMEFVGLFSNNWFRVMILGNPFRVYRGLSGVNPMM